MAKSIVEFVAQYVAENDRGCPKGAILYTGGFTAKDIKDAVTSRKLEAGRGSEGGFFICGERPAPKTAETTLKGEAFALLRSISLGTVTDLSYVANRASSLVEQYDAECNARRKQ